MRSKFKWIFALLVALSMQFSFAQEKTVTGTVSDDKGTLPGANVVVKGTTKGVQTDMDGKYVIKVKQGETLVYSFVGMQDQTKVVGASNTINVVLSSGIKLDEVVVLGYDKKATKPKSVAAVSTVTSESLKNRPNVTVLQSLAGNAAGLNVFASSGSPGSAKFDLLIRGLGSANSSTEPLYIVDGVATNSVVFRSINPEDIDAISVLKDASATSIYGNRGANGVVVIKTKNGKFNSALKVTYSSTYGISELPGHKYNLMDSRQLLTLQRDRGVSAGAGQNALLSDYLGANFGDPLTDEQIRRAPNQNWMDVFFRTSETQSHNISLSSGGEKLNQFTSFSYINQAGIVNNTDFQRFTMRNNLNGKNDSGKFTYGSSFTVAFSTRNQLGQETNDGINNNVVQNPLLGGVTGVPYFAESFYPGSGQGLYDLIGTDFDGGNTTLVLQDLLQEGNQPNRYKEFKLLGNFNLNYKITNNISFDNKFGVDYNVSDRIFARAPWSYLAIAVRETTLVSGAPIPYGGFEQRTNDKDFGFSTINSLKYNKTFGKHTVDFGVYTEYVKAYRQVGLHQQNGLDLLNYAFGAGTGWTNVGATYPTLRPTNSAAKNKAGTFSYFANLTYDFADKYGLDAVIRRDASYRFVDENKWGTFWSVGARWNINKEAFMANSIVNLLKLRLSTGIQGNQNLGVPAFGSNPLYTNSNLVRDLASTAVGYGNTSGYGLSQFGNNTLKWEEQRMTNIGIDFGIWKDRISGNIDLYDRTTNDLFSGIPLSAGAGAGTGIAGNNGKLQNRGIEVALRLKVVRGDNFNVELFANGSYNKNKYLQIEENIGDITIDAVGTQVSEYFVVPFAGVNPDNGEYLFYDINGELTENPTLDDRRRSGRSSIPIYQGGFGLNVDFKGFFLDSQFSWVKDVWRLDNALLWLNTPAYLTDNNMSADILNAWTPDNTNTDIPSLDAANFDLAGDLSDKWLKDASYLRLRNVSLGYDFNKKLLDKTFLKGLKLFVQGENLYTWTKWRGMDADSGEATNLGRFPAPRTISFGVNVEF
ncbi:MAG: SusC/RagA family TonB-linked outer membrane protein [Flavobacterium sp.]|nr:SusC/RagA family TonB-linked outer membrane protein [Flavobacterium sp.]